MCLGRDNFGRGHGQNWHLIFKMTPSFSLLSNDSVYARIGTVDSGENRIGKSFKMAALYQKRVGTFPKLG